LVADQRRRKGGAIRGARILLKKTWSIDAINDDSAVSADRVRFRGETGECGLYPAPANTRDAVPFFATLKRGNQATTRGRDRPVSRRLCGKELVDRQKDDLISGGGDHDVFVLCEHRSARLGGDGVVVAPEPLSGRARRYKPSELTSVFQPIWTLITII
jgi:hypothetical protein